MTIRIRTRSASTAVTEKPMTAAGGAPPAPRSPQRWLARVFRNPNLPAPHAASAANEDLGSDALLAFGAEGEQPPAAAPRPQLPAPLGDRSLRLSITSGIGLAAVAMGIAIFALVRAGWMPLAAA